MVTKTENPNGLRMLADRLESMEGIEGRVGWFESAKYPDGTPVAYIAMIQEFGVPQRSIPSRSFMRSTMLEQESAWKTVAAKISAAILEGKLTPSAGMKMLAMQAEGDIAKKIADIQSPPLSPITLGARKYRSQGKKVTGRTIGEIARRLEQGTLDISGVSTKPLVDTAIMIDSLTSVVE